MSDERTTERQALEREREALLGRIVGGLATPMAVLGFIWLILLVLELTAGLSPFLARVATVIWVLFGVEFLLELAVAPAKGRYLRRNWLTVIALGLPALRVVRVVRAVRVLGALRGARLLRLVAGINRGMAGLGRVMGRRNVGYVLALTVLINVAGAAGMYAYERGMPGSTMDSFGAALWWTAMTLTTMGTDYFPRTAGGRVLALLLAVYGFAVFGYVTASIASFFVARDADTPEGELAGARQLEALQQEMGTIARRLEEISARLDRG